MMPLFVALPAPALLHEQLSRARKAGLFLVVAGALILVGWHTETDHTGWNTSRTFGNALFLLASFLTAIFTVITRQTKLDPIHAAALVSTGSLILWFPFYCTL